MVKHKPRCSFSIVFATAVTAHSATVASAQLWQPLGNPSPFLSVLTLEKGDLGDGMQLFAGGTSSTNTPVLMAWSGSSWSVVGEGFCTGSSITALAYRESDGLYVGGDFSEIWSDAVCTLFSVNVALWDGETWVALGDGLTTPSVEPTLGLLTISARDLGPGVGVFAGGQFADLADFNVPIARWNGSAWIGATELEGSHGCFDFEVATLNGFKEQVEVFVAGGYFFDSESNMRPLAMWDGTEWTIGSAVFDDGYGEVRTLKYYQHEEEEHGWLYVGGWFPGIEGTEEWSLARWDGITWESLSPSIAGSGVVYAMEVFEGELYVFADYTGGRKARKWTWDSGINQMRWYDVDWLDGPHASTLISYIVGSQEALVAGGGFAGTPSQCQPHRIAFMSACRVDVNFDGVLDFFDVQQFLAWYAAEDCRADWNGDGIFDFFDNQAFLADYASGCD